MSEYNSVGKLPPEILETDVLRYVGALRPEVLVGPGLGEDAALIRWGDAPYLVAASDPVVGATRARGAFWSISTPTTSPARGASPRGLS